MQRVHNNKDEKGMENEGIKKKSWRYHQWQVWMGNGKGEPEMSCQRKINQLKKPNMPNSFSPWKASRNKSKVRLEGGSTQMGKEKANPSTSTQLKIEKVCIKCVVHNSHLLNVHWVFL